MVVQIPTCCHVRSSWDQCLDVLAKLVPQDRNKGCLLTEIYFTSSINCDLINFPLFHSKDNWREGPNTSSLTKVAHSGPKRRPTYLLFIRCVHPLELLVCFAWHSRNLRGLNIKYLYVLKLITDHLPVFSLTKLLLSFLGNKGKLIKNRKN